MVASDIQNFSIGRTKARAYFCYLFSKNIPNRLPHLDIETIIPRLLKIKDDIGNCESAYLLDYKGAQVTPSYNHNSSKEEDIGIIRADRAYYYRAVREKRCTITDPYPSLVTGGLTVTASQPIFDDEGVVKYVACLDMALDDVLKISKQNTPDIFYAKLFKYSYATFAFALVAISMLLFFKGIANFIVHEITPMNFKIKDVFEATILLTLALAIFDLAKTIIEEEVLGRLKDNNSSGPHKTMVKFLGSIIIALSIEALMLVFKFAITDPSQLLYSMYLVGGVAMLLIGLAFYIKYTKIDELNT